ncbi:MAG: hypothetical protein HY370_03155 [Proteobacteria bacterium]|nr:hypothetical protein [Pseudomonadota bacterium]
MRKILFILLMAAGLIAAAIFPAFADRKAADAGDCPMKDDAYVNISFNNLAVDVSNVKSVLDKKIDEVMALAEAAKIKKPMIQNYSYNVYSSGGGVTCCEGGNCAGGSYQANGNVNFQLSSTEDAAGFATALMQKGYQANLNVSSYRNCSQD